MAAVANSIVELAEGGGTSLGEVDRTRRGGERVLGLGGGGGKQPSLQQEEEGGKEKERAKARKRDNDKKK